MSGRDYYVVLGITRGAGPEAIRRAYVDLAKRYHPDRVGPRGNSYFQEIVEAYEVLSDARQRASYDRGLGHAREEADRARGTPIVVERAAHNESMMRRVPLADRPVRLSELASSLLDEARAAFRGAGLPNDRHMRPVDAVVDLTPDQAARGGTLHLQVPVHYPCSWCRGQARRGGAECMRCGNTGMEQTWQDVNVQIPPIGPRPVTLDVPVRGLGLSNRFLRLHLRRT